MIICHINEQCNSIIELNLSIKHPFKQIIQKEIDYCEAKLFYSRTIILSVIFLSIFKDIAHNIFIIITSKGPLIIIIIQTNGCSFRIQIVCFVNSGVYNRSTFTLNKAYHSELHSRAYLYSFAIHVLCHHYRQHKTVRHQYSRLLLKA